MKKIVITTSDGKEYPARMTMGAMLLFKRETGKEVTESSSVSDMVTLIWSCCKSACNADGVEFNFDCQSFADRLNPDAVNTFTEAINSNTEPDGKKKIRVI